MALSGWFGRAVRGRLRMSSRSKPDRRTIVHGLRAKSEAEMPIRCLAVTIRLSSEILEN
jgi:hypothetical protein